MAADGKETFGKSLSKFITNRLPYQSYTTMTPVDQLNPVYKDFVNKGSKRVEALQRQSISASTLYNNTPIPGLIDSYKDAFFYANIQQDKAARLGDYRVMAAFSEVSNCLDQICDEIVNKDIDGNIVKLVLKNLEKDDLSENDVKILNHEFKRYVQYFDLEYNGWEYFRQMLTEGELYFEHVIHKDHKDKGILGVLKIPSELIDPVFGNVQNHVIKGYLLRKPVFDPKNPQKIEKFEFIPMDINQVTYVNSGIWNENKTIRLPFIENARRAYRQLSLVEDSIVIYRLVRAPERLVFNVDTGNLPNPQAESYLKKLQQMYWKKFSYDPQGGGTVTKFSPQSMLDSFWFAKKPGSEGTTVTQLPGGCLTMDTKVPLLDGRTLSIKELTNEYKSGVKNWVYSCNPDNGHVAPGLISWAGVTQKSAKVMKITYDNGKSDIVTPDHKFPIIGKGFVEAKDLVVGESMIPYPVTITVSITAIEQLPDQIEVGTLTIDVEEKYHNYHTFALESGVFTKNSNLGELSDLMYFVKKLYQSLKVPVTRLNPEDAFKDGLDILREELKFANFLIRQQQRFAIGLKNGYITHLKLMGIWDKLSLNEMHIDLVFNVPTNFYEMRQQQKLELRLNNFGSATQNDFISKLYGMKKYLDWTDDDIKANREFLRKDRELLWELEQISAGGPNWRDTYSAANQQQQQGGEPGMASGGGMPPSFGPGPGGDIGGDESGLPPETPQDTDLPQTPPQQPGVPATPQKQPVNA